MPVVACAAHGRAPATPSLAGGALALGERPGAARRPRRTSPEARWRAGRAVGATLRPRAGHTPATPSLTGGALALGERPGATLRPSPVPARAPLPIAGIASLDR